MHIPTLTTARLVLRPFTAADVPAYAATNADRETARHLGDHGAPLSAEESWRQLAMFIGHWELRGFGMWAIALRELPDVLIGRAGAHQPEGWPDFEIGWALATAHRGRGYATEAGAAAIRHAFEVLDRPRIISVIRPANAPSRAVAERLGERKTDEWIRGGASTDIYSLERDDWLVLRDTPGSPWSTHLRE